MKDFQRLNPAPHKSTEWMSDAYYDWGRDGDNTAVLISSIQRDVAIGVIDG